MTKKLTFEKDEFNAWRIKLPFWPFGKDRLLMVTDAHTLLTDLSNGSNEVRMTVVTEEPEAYDFKITAINAGSTTGGRTYKGAYNGKTYNNIWLCPVTLFVMGHYPDTFYVKMEA